MRKHILHADTPPDRSEIPVASIGTVLVTSERPGHPIEHAFDSQRGAGGTRWVAEKPGEQTVIVAFDTPQQLSQVSLEVEEREVSRTQELQLSLSNDGGSTYREICRQEFNFSPSGATFEREAWTVSEPGATHVKVWIKPDKGGRPCYASLTSLVLR